MLIARPYANRSGRLMLDGTTVCSHRPRRWSPSTRQRGVDIAATDPPRLVLEHASPGTASTSEVALDLLSHAAGTCSAVGSFARNPYRVLMVQHGAAHVQRSIFVDNVVYERGTASTRSSSDGVALNGGPSILQSSSSAEMYGAANRTGSKEIGTQKVKGS